MKFLSGLIILTALVGCSKPTTTEMNTAKVDSTDSTFSLVTPPDTLSYIGHIQKFEDNSFYTDLLFVDNFHYDMYEELTKKGQLIFDNGEIKRTRIEIEDVGQYFNLTGLRTVSIYNSDNLKLTTGRLSHIEYFEDLIEGKFIAVFKVENTNISEPLFCVGNSNVVLTGIDFSSYEDEGLKSKLLHDLELEDNSIWNVTHYKLDNNTIYSTISADTTAYIVETLNEKNNTLYKSRASETIAGLTMVSKKINGRPIFLTHSGMPETDMTWSSVLIFDGTEYQPSKDHRIGKD